MSPVLDRPPRAPRSHPVKPGAQAPGVGKGTTASRMPTGAPRATGPDEARRTNAGPEGTPKGHAAGHNQGTRTGAKQQRPPGAANPESAHNTQRTTAQEQVPSNTSRRPDGRVRARTVPKPYRLRTAAVRMDECAPGGYPAPAGYEQPLSGWTSERPAAKPRTRNPKHSTQSEHTGDQGPSCPGHRTCNTAHRAGAPVNRSHLAQDTVHTKQHTERAHR